MSERPVLLLVGSGERWYREYLLAGAAARHEVWLLESGPVGWQRPYLAGHDRVDVTDPAELLRAARRLPAGRPAAGVLCWDEALIHPAAILAEALGLPGPGADAIGRCRDKAATRECLSRAGVPQPASTVVGSPGEARAVAGAIGYPVVLKPRGLGASQGVRRADGPHDLAGAYRDAATAFHPGVPVHERGVLVEEYLDGPEVSVDSAVTGGVVTPLTLARKEIGLAPYFEETGHLVRAADPLLRDPVLLSMLRKIHAALGIGSGMTHVELRLTASGPRVIEVNGRLGGDLIPFLGRLAHGVDHGRVAAEVALGLPLSTETTPGRPRGRTAGIRFRYPERDCRVREVLLPAVPGGTVDARGNGAVDASGNRVGDALGNRAVDASGNRVVGGQPEGAAPVGGADGATGGASRSAGGAVGAVVRLDALAEPGEVVRLPPRQYATRYAAVVCVADDADTCDRLLTEVAGGIALVADVLEDEPMPATVSAGVSGADVRGRTPVEAPGSRLASGATRVDAAVSLPGPGVAP
ncbi:ATP-grasp domain-containing protein [Kineosporia sp. J2-2]|uniref:ATP-grasp domain-containing protein n=1 Tax=Kineosporia corallincola TaxID=2835133 RepID=A0ABS5TBW7_9ACTN|nr:ATP-grasp domain-containing protein [Kineosporia corallincola]MBT0768575.1 ATP-grasp domain-containing protein [Kineosporia corallincola]